MLPPGATAQAAGATADVGPSLPSGAAPRAADPRELWSRVLAAIAGKPSLNWIEAFELRRYADGVAVLAVRPGQRDRAKFGYTQGKEQLPALLAGVVGRPVRIEWERPPAGGAATGPAARAGLPSGSAGAPGTRVSGSAGHAEAREQADAGGEMAPAASQMQQAMNLPLVRQVLAMFDATLVEVRAEGETTPAPDVSPPAPEAAEAGAALFPLDPPDDSPPCPTQEPLDDEETT